MPKEISGYGNLYLLYPNGKIWSARLNKFFVGYVGKRGYRYTLLRDENRVLKIHKIHRLIAETFIPNPLNLPQVNHKNGVKDDNSIENLEWVTAQQNSIHAYKNGLSHGRPGEKHHNARLTLENVKQIFRLRKIEKVSEKFIAKQFGVSQHHICDILNGRKWANV